MFTIIGGDGKEYGPVSTDQVRAWIAAGRANLDTQARAAGSEEFRPLRDYPEFSAPPPLGAPPVAYATPDAGATLVSPDLPLAGRGARTGAALINALLYFFAMLPGSIAMTRTIMANNPEIREGRMPDPASIDMTGLPEAMVWFWLGLGGAFLIQSILLAWRGQNIGKLLTGIRVVRARTGESAGFVRGALLRFLLPVTVMLVLHGTTLVLGLALLVLDYCFIFRNDRRCLHDLIAGTTVVRA